MRTRACADRPAARRAAADRRASRRCRGRRAALSTSRELGSPSRAAMSRAASCASSRVKLMAGIGENHRAPPSYAELVPREARGVVGARGASSADDRRPDRHDARHVAVSEAVPSRPANAGWTLSSGARQPGGGRARSRLRSFRRTRATPRLPEDHVLYICIPAYNEAPTVGVLLWRIRKVFQEYRASTRSSSSTTAAPTPRPRRSSRTAMCMPLTVLGGRARRLRPRARRAVREASRARAIRAATR